MLRDDHFYYRFFRIYECLRIEREGEEDDVDFVQDYYISHGRKKEEKEG